ncbi:MAG: VanZ family protein [Candidatus Aminicenantes bacterium]|nr:VanZ family protein [Candidatus Aminicenantes bacterium]
MTSIKTQKIVLSWLWVTLCVLAIFFTVPLARKIQNLVTTLAGRSFFGYFVLFATAATFLVLGYILYFRLNIRAISNYIWLVLISAIYVYFTLKLWANPEEAIHFIQYGLLGFFLFRAFRHHIGDKNIYFAAFLLGTLIGIFDEILQWIVPGRYFDLRDVGLNALSSGLFQILLWKGVRPKLPYDKIQPKSIKIISILLAANLLLLGLCLSNTPQRVKKYTKALPFLSGLKNQEAMSEFKFKHRDLDIGIFYSRLTLEELKNIDQYRAEEFGDILRNWQTKDYAEYLRIFPGGVAPFLHEIRVHIFRRAKRLERALSSDDEAVQRENFLIAYKENLILEKYFGQTLERSPYGWDESIKAQVLAPIDPKAPYESPVGAGVWATVNERVTWIIISVCLAILLAINLYFARIAKTQDKKKYI